MAVVLLLLGWAWLISSASGRIETSVSPELDLCSALDMESTCAHQSIFVRKMPPGVHHCFSWAALCRGDLILPGLELAGECVPKTQLWCIFGEQCQSAARVHGACQLAEWVLQSQALGWCCSHGGWEGPGLGRSQQKDIYASCLSSRVTFQNRISCKCAWLHDVVSFSFPSSCRYVSDQTFYKTFLAWDLKNLASVLLNLVSHHYFLLLLTSLKMLWAP